MKIVDKDKNGTTISYYLPRHAIIKKNNLTTKLRAVFDGSAKSSSGYSLNDLLYAGPTIQQDLFSLLIRFRTYKYTLTADIAKMYRQVLINPSQTLLQRIVWHQDASDPIQVYKHTTVTNVNLIVQIKSVTKPDYWNIRTFDNPTDTLSGGASIGSLLNNTL